MVRPVVLLTLEREREEKVKKKRRRRKNGKTGNETQARA
jgi:hypothetical protein